MKDLVEREKEYTEAVRKAASQKYSQTTEKQKTRHPTPLTELERIIQETKLAEKAANKQDIEQANKDKYRHLSGSLLQEQSYIHLKTSKDFKQRKELLSKALVRDLIEQLCSAGSL